MSTLIRVLIPSVLLFSISALGATANGVTPLSGTAVIADDREFAPLDRLASAEGVGIGESAHGVREYMRMELRLIRYFVEKHGFRQVFIENEVFLSEPAIRYVDSGAGDLDTAVKSIWNANQDWREILRYLRTWNENHPNDRVRLLGADVYETPYVVHSYLKSAVGNHADFTDFVAAIEKSCPGHLLTNAADWDALFLAIIQGTVPYTDSDYLACREALFGTRDRLRAEPAKYTAAFTQDGYFRAILSAQVLVARQTQAHAFAGQRNPLEHWNMRDAMLADNIQTLREQHGPSAKFLWLAHTSHTSQFMSKAAWWTFGLGEMKGAGEFLKQSHGVNYASIGFTGDAITGQDMGFLRPTSADSLDIAIRGLGHAYALIDTEGPFCAQKPRWYVQNENQPGAPEGVLLDPKEHFDFYIFFATSPASEPLARKRRRIQ